MRSRAGTPVHRCYPREDHPPGATVTGMSLTRTTIASVLSAGLIAGLTLTAPSAAQAASPSATVAAAAAVNKGKAPCTKLPNLKGKKPGQLLAYKEVKVDPQKLTGARMFRVLYTTTGVDERSVEATCGLVLMPKKPKKRTNEVVAWAHGTIGVHQSCQPSNDPDAFLNLGIIKYGNVLGTASNGILQTFINRGQMLTATDYYSGMGLPANAQQNYILGVPAGAAVLDSVRTGIVLSQKLGSKKAKKYEMAVWGASQGGAAALWAGQLAKDYLAKTKVKKQPKIDQVGVVATVPASQYVATENTAPELIGRHLADLEMHEPALVNGQPAAVMGPLLFSLVMTSWSKYPKTGTLSPGANFPGYPADAGNIAMSDVLTSEGIDTANTISASCLGLGSGLQTTKYLQPQQHAFFAPPIWGGPTGPNGAWLGQLDKTCLDPATPQGQKNWCEWLSYNQPGPNGTNPFSKYPLRANGKQAPVLIAEGMADNIIYCMSSGTAVPAAGDCMAVQLYESMAPACSATKVQLDLFAVTPKDPSDHLTTTFQLADAGGGKYKGSRMDTFLKSAFKDTVKPGCSAQVVNAG
jgi:hypothetical protein